MYNLILFLLFNQTIEKEKFLLIEKDSISFLKIINEVKKQSVKQDCFP
jgi:hypothetical protein